MENQITSALWKANMLSMHSVYFPRLVEMAAWYTNTEYSEDMLRRVAATPDIIGAINLHLEDSSIDTVLAKLAVEHGESLDSLIIAAVSASIPPERE